MGYVMGFFLYEMLKNFIELYVSLTIEKSYFPLFSVIACIL